MIYRGLIDLLFGSWLRRQRILQVCQRISGRPVCVCTCQSPPKPCFYWEIVFYLITVLFRFISSALLTARLWGWKRWSVSQWGGPPVKRDLDSARLSNNKYSQKYDVSIRVNPSRRYNRQPFSDQRRGMKTAFYSMNLICVLMSTVKSDHHGAWGPHSASALAHMVVLGCGLDAVAPANAIFLECGNANSVAVDLRLHRGKKKSILLVAQRERWMNSAYLAGL